MPDLKSIKVADSDGYEGGKQNRRSAGFRPNIDRSADLEISGDWDLITARGRWLGRNNAWCRGAKWTITDNLIRSGVRTRSTVRDNSGELIDSWNDEANRLYDQWTRQADIAGRQPLQQMTRTGLMTTVESGEVFYVLRQDADGFRRNERTIPLAFEMVEPDQLDTTLDRAPDATRGVNEVRRGIEFDSEGRRVAYHFYTQHPGALNPIRAGLFDSEPVPASRVIHLYRAERPTQTRGVTWYAPIVTSLWNLYEYQSAEIDAAKVASYFIYLWKQEDPTGGQSSTFGLSEADGADPTDLFDNAVEPLVPGLGLSGGINDDLKVIKSDRAPSQAVPWLQLMLQTMGVGLHLGYSKFTGDFTKGNWAQLRAEDQNDQRGFEPLRQWHADYIDLAIRKLAIRQMVAFGVLPIPSGGVAQFNRNPEKWLACDFLPPRQGYLNPREEVMASWDAVRSGQASPSMVAERLGLNFNEIVVSGAKDLGISEDEYRQMLLQNLGVPGQTNTNAAESVGRGTDTNDA